jgi:chromosome segregation ATPase
LHPQAKWLAANRELDSRQQELSSLRQQLGVMENEIRTLRSQSHVARESRESFGERLSAMVAEKDRLMEQNQELRRLLHNLRVELGSSPRSAMAARTLQKAGFSVGRSSGAASSSASTGEPAVKEEHDRLSRLQQSLNVTTHRHGTSTPEFR